MSIDTFKSMFSVKSEKHDGIRFLRVFIFMQGIVKKAGTPNASKSINMGTKRLLL